MQNNIARMILIAVAALVAFSIFLSFAGYFPRTIRDAKPVNSVILVTSAKKEAGHLDLLLFVNYSPREGFLNIIPIPSETKVTLKNNKSSSIGKIFENSYKSQKNVYIAANDTKKALEDIFLNKVTIPYYFALNRNELESISDILGGVPVDLDQPILRKDASGFSVIISTGRHLLSGQNIVDYLAPRPDSQDYAAALRVQTFLKALVGRFSNPLSFLEFPKLSAVLGSGLRSNLNRWDFVFGFFELKDLNPSKIQTFELPGNYKRPFFEPNFENITGLFAGLFPESGSIPQEGPKARLEVWNASGKNNLAEKVAWMLRDKGYDVVEFGTFSVKQKKTLIKDLSGDLKTAQDIAETISCGEIVTRFDARRYVDISLILGEDCKIDQK